VEQHDSRAVLTATVPPGFMRKAIAESPPQLTPMPPRNQQKAQPPSK